MVPHWNGLPELVVTTPSTNAFRNRSTSTGPIWAIKALLLSSSSYEYKYKTDFNHFGCAYVRHASLQIVVVLFSIFLKRLASVVLDHSSLNLVVFGIAFNTCEGFFYDRLQVRHWTLCLGGKACHQIFTYLLSCL